jgi:uncharacterized protein with PQ loop repeat
VWIAEIFGFIGGALGTLQGVPQAWRIYRMKTGYGVSISSWILMLVRMSTWMGYGWLMASPSIAVSNFIGALTSALVVAAMRPHRLRAWLWIVPVHHSGFTHALSRSSGHSLHRKRAGG